VQDASPEPRVICSSRWCDVIALPGARHLGTVKTSVLGHAALGFTDREIARRLDMTVGSVRYQLRQAVAMLEAKGRTDAVAMALVLRCLALRPRDPSVPQVILGP
jgi:DNA-binding CsgD family transcriptional regulator